MVDLRPATPADLPVLARLARAFYDEDGFTTTDADLLRNFELLLAAADAHLVLALAEGEVVGFALSTVGFVLESGWVVELQDLYVVPEARGAGVGGVLVEDAATWAVSRSAALLEVVIAPNGQDVTHVVEYYRARGFIDEGRRILVRPLLQP